MDDVSLAVAVRVAYDARDVIRVLVNYDVVLAGVFEVDNIPESKPSLAAGV